MSDDSENYCDFGLVIRGLDGDARRLIEAMPPERRARFETVRIVSSETVYGPDHDDWDEEWRAFVREQAEEPVVYLLVTFRAYVPYKGNPNERVVQTAYSRFAFTEAMLKDAAYTAQAAELLLVRAELGRDNLIESLGGAPM